MRVDLVWVIEIYMGSFEGRKLLIVAGMLKIWKHQSPVWVPEIYMGFF